jgi:hydroxypyruvate isomerase
MQRRVFLKSAEGIGAGWFAAGASALSAVATKRASRLKQSVCKTAFARNMSFEDTCREAARLGFEGYDFVDPTDWPTLKKFGLIPTLYPQGPAGNPSNGINQKELHDAFEKLTRDALKECVSYGVPNMIARAGLRGTVSLEEGADLNVAFLNRIKAAAEGAGVNICLELVSSPANMFDHLAWGLEVVKRVNSPRVGLLFDIYHVQVKDGNVIEHLRNNFQWIMHIHTAGSPGRHQLDDNQELNYAYIASVIAGLNYKGYIAHEYTPWEGSDPIAGLKQAFEIFDI